MHDQENHNRGTYANGQADNVYQGEQLVPPETPECDFKIVLYHDGWLFVQLFIGDMSTASLFSNL